MLHANRLPPGPARPPLIGSLRAMTRDPLAFLYEMATRYGDVAYTTVGPSRMYALNHPALVEEVLVGRHRDCIKDWGTRELAALAGNGLLTSEGELWKRQRKLASPTLSPRHIAGYADTMVACTRREAERLRDGAQCDIHVVLMRLTLEIVGKTLLGVDTAGEAEAISRIIDVSMAYFDRQFWSWHGILPKWVITRERRAFRREMAELDRIIYRLIARSRADGGEADHLLARLLRARDEDGAAMSDEQLRDEAVTMLLAGHETTALTLSYAIYLLSEHPAAAARVRSELDQVLGGRPAALADLPKLPFTDAVMRETLRLYPPAYAIGREVLRPFEIGGYRLPAGGQIVMSPYAMHRDRRFFEAPERFAPERWLTPSDPPLPRFAYFPFGGGPRVCIGNHFAMMEIVLVLASLLSQVELTVAPGFELELAPYVTLRPRHGVPVNVRRRSAHVETAAELR
jgi:cytochrome P450